MKTLKMKIILVRLQLGLINKQGMVWVNNTSIILSLTIEFYNNVLADDDPDLFKISQLKANICGYKHDCLQRASAAHLIITEDNPDKKVHYTFDYSQNVRLPHHSRQMGPMYFTKLRKIQIFSFRIDGISEQLNFMINEN